MFGGGAPPPPSKEELEAQEAASRQTIQYTVVSCIALYLSPFAIDYVRKLF